MMMDDEDMDESMTTTSTDMDMDDSAQTPVVTSAGLPYTGNGGAMNFMFLLAAALILGGAGLVSLKKKSA